MAESKKVLVTGGGGYIGGVLVPLLLSRGHRVTVLDTFHFGTVALDEVIENPALKLLGGDVRDGENIAKLLARGEHDTIIHLAAIANDPCADLDASLTTSVNRDATAQLMREAKRAGVQRFLYASSASVYGIKDDPDVTEDLPLEPITLYAVSKTEGEKVLNELVSDAFVGCSVRASTVCGYAPRLRLDLTVNLFADQAIRLKKLKIFGGDQKRPNVHVADLARLYADLVVIDPKLINGQAFNICAENASVRSLAERVREEIDPSLDLEVIPSQDNRSYHLSAKRAAKELGFTTQHSVADAIRDVKKAYDSGRVPEPESMMYRNVEFMKREAQRWREIAPWRTL